MKPHQHDETDIWTPPARFTCCGHVAPAAGMQPAETRTLRAWWPFEHLARFQARRMRRAPMHVRDHLDRSTARADVLRRYAPPRPWREGDPR